MLTLTNSTVSSWAATVMKPRHAQRLTLALAVCVFPWRMKLTGKSSWRSPPGVRNSAFETFQTHDKGIGLRTLVNVPARTFVCEYAGEVISLEEARKRSDTFTGDTYLFVIQERSGTASSPIRTCIDARRKGSLGSVHQPLV
ncbi:hypothetical protein BV898_16560 [Hypsibius exemplaris]|uniref:SET domain-containing protein n=1 Tax=Hypsibius exemplaris TaxID=2072580 RepID=A0A9X6RL86_HYPEX|nr:hypothetical protein BV898_16560 [Hypsibius exemplaris]